jgi:HAD superfamily hydrolase (TIGR01509 family)
MPSPTAAVPNPRAVIFDLDGTLVDSVETRIQAWLAVFAEEGIPATHAELEPWIGADGRQLAREVAAAAGIELEPGRDEKIDRRAGEIYDQLNRDPRPLPGARDLLLDLDERGIPWAIATSSRRDQVTTSVEALRLPRPPTIVDGSAVKHAKPAPDLLLLAARQLGVKPAEARYVGDSTWDMRAAVAAGMVPIGVTSGAVDAGALREAGAQLTVASLRELISAG